MLSTGQKIKQLRNQKGITQTELGKILGVEKSTVSLYENDNSSPNYEILKTIAQYFGVTTDYLLGNEETNPFSEQEEASEYIRIPVLGLVKAGLPSDAIEEILDWEEIPKDWMKGGKEYFALKISGDSMLPRMEEGDVIIIQKQPWCDKSGDVMVVRVNGDEATVKKVLLQDNGILLVAYNNSEYPPIFYSKKDMRELPVEYLGKVVELRGKF